MDHVTTPTGPCPITKLAIVDPASPERLHLVDPLRRRSSELPPMLGGLLEATRHDNGNRWGLPASTLAKRFDHADSVPVSSEKIVMQNLVVVSCNPLRLRQKWRKDAFERQACEHGWSMIGVQEQRDEPEGATEAGDYIVVSSPCCQPANHGCGIWISKTIVIATAGGEKVKATCDSVDIVFADCRRLVISLRTKAWYCY